MDRRQFLKYGSFITVSVASGLGERMRRQQWRGQQPAGGQRRVEIPAKRGLGRSARRQHPAVDPRRAGQRPITWLPWRPAPMLRSHGGRSADNSKALGSNAALSGATVADVVLPLQAQYDNTVRHKLTGLTPQPPLTTTSSSPATTVPTSAASRPRRRPMPTSRSCSSPT
jgi:alkaline phosphatase D